MLVTDTNKQFTRHINHIKIIKLQKKKYTYMNKKHVKGWQNVDKLYAEYKQAIQKSWIECLKGVVYCCCIRKCISQFFEIWWNSLPKFRWNKSESRGPKSYYLLLAVLHTIFFKTLIYKIICPLLISALLRELQKSSFIFNRVFFSLLLHILCHISKRNPHPLTWGRWVLLPEGPW